MTPLPLPLRYPTKMRQPWILRRRNIGGLLAVLWRIVCTLFTLVENRTRARTRATQQKVIDEGLEHKNFNGVHLTKKLKSRFIVAYDVQRTNQIRDKNSPEVIFNWKRKNREVNTYVQYTTIYRPTFFFLKRAVSSFQ